MKFEGRVRWITKQFPVKDTIRRLIEEGIRCAVCSDPGHSSWDCRGKNGAKLSQSLAHWEPTETVGDEGIVIEHT